MKVTLLKTIPSSSHNAPYSEELGEHWPAGQEFKLLGKNRQDACRKFYRVKDTSTVVEQIGGEEVLVVIPNEQFPELFGIESPYAQQAEKPISFTGGLIVSDVKVGDRIELISMPEDPRPIEPGATGTVQRVSKVTDWTSIEVDWDNGRSLSLAVPPDRFRIIGRAEK